MGNPISGFLIQRKRKIDHSSKILALFLCRKHILVSNFAGRDMKHQTMKYAGFVILMCWAQLLLAQEPGAKADLPSGDSVEVMATDSLEMALMDSTEISEELPLENPTVEAPKPSSDFISALPSELPAIVVESEEEQNREPVLVQYTTDFQFIDGIYANFDMVLANDPIPQARIVTELDMFDRAFYEKITAGKQIVIYDQNGVKKELDTHEIWGYGRNGILYINVGSAFHRISFVGSICHFVATVTTYNPNYYDPYYYNPSYSRSYYYNRYSSPQSNTASTDLRQYLLDFQSGDIMEYETESVEVLLMKDPELSDEYHALSNRKKKQMKFVFIRRFNEKHPLYFPVN